MASILEVQTTLKTLITNVIYPNGIAQPSIIDNDVIIMLGYPVKGSLDSYMKDGKVAVSISTVEKMDRNTTRYSKRWHNINVPNANVVLTVGNDFVITVSGTPTNNEIATIVTSSETASYQITDLDTLDDIAAALGAQLTGAVVVNNTIFVSGETFFKVGVAVKALAAKEIKRQQKIFCVTLWSPNEVFRDQLGEAVDVYLSDIERFVLPDDFFARIIYNGTVDMDSIQQHRIYKREIEYLIEYPTTITEEFTTLVVTQPQIEDNRQE